MIDLIPLLPGVELRCCRDGRFKQGCLTVQLIRPMRQEEAAMNALIPTVLLRGTTKHPDLRSVTMLLDDLYGAAVSPLVRRVGDYQTVGLSAGFMDQRFALPGDRVLEPLVAFLREVLMDSPLEDGGFCREFVESEKKNLISTIESDLNDKHAYSMNKLMRILCKEDAFGIPRLGEKEQVAAIDPKVLYAHYRQILKDSQIRIFYVGSEAPERVAELVRPLFAGLDRQPMTLAPQTVLRQSEKKQDTECLEVAQGKLCMGFTTPIHIRESRFAAMQVMNTVFGGGMTSKLFQNVREKQSLCYSIGSGYYGTKGILVVYAGIDFDKETTVREEVLHQLELCRRGEISEEELTAAKEALISSLRSTHDTPGSIESYYATAALSGIGMDPWQYMAAVEAVTTQQVAEAAQSVSLHSTYFLKGVQCHD